MALSRFFQCFKKQSKPVDLQKEQRKQAIAVAAATAAAADAAVAAAEAAIAVVRLTNQRRTDREIWSAVKIQSAFRAHLARRALRALKALVKLQALVKGFLVRRQTARALQSMHAMMRIQTRKSPLQLEIQTPRSSQSTPKSTMAECNIIPHRPGNYMASTESSTAKLRCQSVPRHRRVSVSCERERMVVVRPRGSLSGVGREAEVSLKSAILGRLNRVELSSEDEERDYRHMRRRW